MNNMMLTKFFICGWLVALSTALPFGQRQPPAHPRGFATAKHALIIGCDGFGGMYLENATSFLPNLGQFYLTGAVTTRARDQMPSVSAPNWCSIITGQGPEESGVPQNGWVPDDDNPPNPGSYELPPISGTGKIPETMWRAAKEQNSTIVTASVESWDWIHYLVEPEVVDYEYRGKEDDKACAENLVDIIQKHKPNLMFIHFDSIDDAGHGSFWGSQKYYDTAKTVDGYIGQILTALSQADILNQTLVMVTADHGGFKSGHGDFSEADMFIPALFMGPGVIPGTAIKSYVTDKDFAPTALNALGLQPGKYMVGRVVEDIYKYS